MYYWISRIVLGTFALTLLGVTILLFVVWSQTRREFHAFEQRHQQTEQRLRQMQDERAVKEAYLRAFLADPQFVERVIRERLGYVEPGELIFRYPE